MGDWPEPDTSVKAIRRQDAAFQTVRLLIEAYRLGEERRGSIDWNDLDQAYQVALKASAGAVDGFSYEMTDALDRIAKQYRLKPLAF